MIFESGTTEVHDGAELPPLGDREVAVRELSPVPLIGEVLEKLSHWPHLVAFDSALPSKTLGRFSFVSADPCWWNELPKATYGVDPFAEVRRLSQTYQVGKIEGLPPFQGGIAGFLSYELGHAWERLPRTMYDEFQMPAAAFGCYDWVIAWDHQLDRAWIISQGYPERDPMRRQARAQQRLEQVVADIVSMPGKTSVETLPHTSLGRDELAPQFDAPGVEGLTSDFSREGYLQAVRQVIEHIYAGDIFQANLSQRLLLPQRLSSLELYGRLRQRNPAPFAGLLRGNAWDILSASPERFVSLCGRDAETRPIKGTRQRQPGIEADLYTRDALRESEKDQAENVMIADLLRNDLSRVCQPGSIRVPELCRVETYSTVQHLVTAIRGRLAYKMTAWDLLTALSPGGSITGAPKVRAMEVIASIEPTARGPYCGSLFHVGFHGGMDSNIIIRTFVVRSGWIQCSVGGGIVAQSDPASEYLETLHKAEGMLRALK
ncbi:MAG: anthranilate synthase component I family protein [Planctomycetota bacterium]|nr:anthranilate synthase component I family protein [Planctomycetota bacterium]MDA1212160.1 anthranilate synthase component I family protein [Planctomycetota bacterium]